MNKDVEFDNLVAKVKKCDRCARMCSRERVLSRENGNLNAKVIFIAEAPGRLGAECTGIPLKGDQTGKNFEILLEHIGWKREDVFITNSILCNPQENNKNVCPNKDELINCIEYLTKILEIINPVVIVTLGIYALNALKIIRPHKYILNDYIAQKISWNSKFLVPLYHMSPITINCHRSFDEQKGDFLALSKIVDPIYGLKS